jgi:hypothetical protein
MKKRKPKKLQEYNVSEYLKNKAANEQCSALFCGITSKLIIYFKGESFSKEEFNRLYPQPEIIRRNPKGNLIGHRIPAL